MKQLRPVIIQCTSYNYKKKDKYSQKLSFARNGSGSVKTVETINLLLRAMKMFNFAIFQSQGDLPFA